MKNIFCSMEKKQRAADFYNKKFKLGLMIKASKKFKSRVFGISFDLGNRGNQIYIVHCSRQRRMEKDHQLSYELMKIQFFIEEG